MTASVRFKKIAVINFSGNVGKSTLARYLLAPRLPGATLVAIESINSDALSGQVVRGSEFGRLQEDMLLEETALVDIGSSNVEQFLDLMRQFHGSHEDFDLYVVPCVPAAKQQRDTMACVRALAQLGIPRDKIRLVLNMVPAGAAIEDEFAPLFAFSVSEGLCLVDRHASVERTELFGRLRELEASIEGVLSDATDYKKAIAQTRDADEKLALASRLSVRRLAAGAVGSLDQAFHALMTMAAAERAQPGAV